MNSSRIFRRPTCFTGRFWTSLERSSIVISVIVLGLFSAAVLRRSSSISLANADSLPRGGREYRPNDHGMITLELVPVPRDR